ncbi:MAG: thioester reductase domain-containing protein [Mycobacterium sp.]
MGELSAAEWIPDRSVPILDLSVGSLLRSTAARAPDAVALVAGVPEATQRRRWTYAELLEQSERAARALLARFAPGDRVAVWANNIPEWVILELAAGLAGITLVTVNPALRAEELTYVLRQSRSDGIFFVPEFRGSAKAEMLDAIRCELPALRERVSFDEWAAFCASGSPTEPLPDVDPGAAAQILYTSGTTGRPKGAVLHHRGIVNNARLTYVERLGFHPGMVQLSALPLFHVAGCAVSVLGSIACAGTLVLPPFFDPELLLELIEAERPACFFGVPTMLIACVDHPRAGQTDLSSVRVVITGGAVVLPELVRRVEELFDAPMCIGFGMTESLGLITAVSPDDEPTDRYTTVGRPLAQTEVKIVDETGQSAAADASGELCARGYLVMAGYFNNPEATAATIDADGWLHTGDLASMDSRGYCRITGRLKDMIIRGGENIYPREIEQLLFEHEDVADVAVVGVPDLIWGEQVAAFIRPVEGRSPDPDRLRAYCRERLAPHKLPQHWIILDEFPLTPSGKVQKYVLRDRFLATEAAATTRAEDQTDELRALRSGGPDQPVPDTVRRALQATLGCSPAQVRADARFTDLGGDSLSALTLSKLLEEIFDIEVPVGVLIDPTGDLEQLTNYIEKQRHTGSKRSTFAAAHGRDSSEVWASDLTLDKFIDAKILQDAQTLSPPSGAANTVLMSGATGYLGRFLCLEWLQRLAQTGGSVICIARGSNPAAARERIDNVFDSGDAELTRHFQTLAAEHLEVLAGDIGEPNLGLDEATWNRLARSVDLIVHPAALVNHVLPYSQLFGPNVVGTAELIRLALTTKLKPITYVSTIGVAALGDDVIGEGVDIRIASPMRNIDDTYANGYATSKWAGEVLLREAHDQCSLPVAVFRCDMILAHSRYAGQLNVPDLFTRLLLSLVATGIAPHSFYDLDAQGNRKRAHYDGLPVDFIAEAIAALGGRATDGFRTYHVVNPYDDGISLDQFVDWLIEAGHPIHRIDDYDNWLTRFETAMAALPDKQRHHSELTLLEAFRPPALALRGPALPAQTFRDGVRAAAIGPEHDIPHLSASLIAKYIADLQQLDLL